MDNYKLAVSGRRLDMDGDSEKKVNESYLIQAESVCEADAIAVKQLASTFNKGDGSHDMKIMDISINSVVKTKYNTVLWDPELVLSCEYDESDFRSFEIDIAHFQTDHKGKTKADLKVKLCVFTDNIDKAQEMALSYGSTTEIKMEVTSAKEMKYLSYLTGNIALKSPLAQS